MRLSRDRHSLRQRVIALAAAYVIALSGLIASFATAQAAVQIGTGLGVICHSEGAGSDTSAPGTADSKLCADCCTGCMMLGAALPPPPVTSVALTRIASAAIHFVTTDDVVRVTTATSNRSRAPPLPL